MLTPRVFIQVDLTVVQSQGTFDGEYTGRFVPFQLIHFTLLCVQSGFESLDKLQRLRDVLQLVLRAILEFSFLGCVLRELFFLDLAKL